MAVSIGLAADDLRLLTRIEVAGWRMVPVDAPRAMVEAGDEIAPGQARMVWDAMTANAPGLGRHVE